MTHDPGPIPAADSTWPYQPAKARGEFLDVAAHRYSADPSETQLESLAAAVTEVITTIAAKARAAADAMSSATTGSEKAAGLRWFADYLESGQR